jgi:tRNA(fMet)-specific endonuclease VapC
MSYLIDTDWLIDAVKQREPALKTLRALTPGGISISWISVAEVYEGPFSSPFPQSQLVALKHFISTYRILGIDDVVAESFARTRAHLRRHGAMVADLDLLIAATALAYDLTLLTFNQRHFQRIPNLRLYSSS